MNVELKTIGHFESCYRDKFAVPRQAGLVKSSWARIKFEKEFQPEQSLEGLEGFSHVWVMWVFHKNSNQRFHAKVHPPRMAGKTVGVFATRSPHHPNPIGLSLMRIEKVESPYVYLSGVDVMDGTPVLDIKPYLTYCESVPDAKQGWVQEVQDKKIQVYYEDSALEALLKWQNHLDQEYGLKGGKAPKIQNLIEETIQLDPRPLVYRGFEGSDSPYRDIHAFRLFDGDVHFKFENPERALVVQVIEKVEIV